MPQGFDQVEEATLPEAETLLGEKVRTELRRWWLAVGDENTRTPNWDIASACSIDGRPGLLLVEAKAHDRELVNEETGRKGIEPPVSVNARRNHLRIGWCIHDANITLAGETGLTWSLSRDWNYQMSNRFTWAWKLTELGIPTVLVYLGFLKANEMAQHGKPFVDHTEWEGLVLAHSRPLFPVAVWNQRWMCHGQPLIPLIRSVEQSLVCEETP